MPKTTHRGSVRRSDRSMLEPSGKNAPHAVIVIDARVEDGVALARANDSHATIIRIDRSSDGLETLAQQLSEHREITTLHLVAHVSEGAIELGSTVLTVEALTRRSEALATIGNAMRTRGDILLYGYDITTDGGKLMFTLAELTAADVAASVNTMGRSGDGVLETAIGGTEVDSTPGSAALRA